MSEMKITLRVIELPAGGFVLAEELDNGEFDATQAVSSIDEACGSIQRRVRDWGQECRQLRAAELEDQSPKVVAPHRWWRAIK